MRAKATTDPTREEMIAYLKSQSSFDGQDEIEIGMYWFAHDWHGGQWSNLYSVLSTSPYKPGPLMTFQKEEPAVQMVYEILEEHFVSK